MGAVDVGVGHDDDLVVAQLVDVELVAADAGAQRGDQRADFLADPASCRSGRARRSGSCRARAGSPGSRGRGPAWPSRLRCRPRPGTASDLAGSRSWQSASLPGRVAMSSAPLRRVSSRALRAASRAAAASTTLPMMSLASAGCSSNQSPSVSRHHAFDRRAHLGGDQLVLGLASRTSGRRP